MILDFAQYCDEGYNREKKCDTCPNVCPETGNCERCLEKIHFGNGERTYNCDNIYKFYTCKYLFKYASEIEYIFNKSHFNDLQNLNVLSIGCGPGTDFFGILNSITKNNRQTVLNYFGIELNSNWTEYHNWISERHNAIFEVLYADALEFLNNPLDSLGDFRPNIIIISYLLSDMIKGGSNVNNFITQLINKLIILLPKDLILILNDYNRGVTQYDPRFYYRIIEDEFRDKCKIKSARYHYVHNVKDNYYRYGFQHENNDVLTAIPSDFSPYNPWTFCSSAQIIIRKMN